MKKLKQIVLPVAAILLLASCASTKKRAYTAEELTAFKSFLESKEYVFKARWANPLASQGLNAIANAGLLAPGNTPGSIDLFNSYYTMDF